MQPVTGIAKTKPRTELPGERLDRAENAALSREYITSRNKRLALCIQKEEAELAKFRNELFEKKALGLQLAYLLTGLRQQLLTLPQILPRHLQGKSEQEMARIIRKQLHQVLSDLTSWPGRISDPEWLQKIDPDFQPEAEAEDQSMSPEDLRTKQQTLKRQRQRKLARKPNKA